MLTKYFLAPRGVFCLWDDGVVLTLVKKDNINEVL